MIVINEVFVVTDTDSIIQSISVFLVDTTNDFHTVLDNKFGKHIQCKQKHFWLDKRHLVRNFYGKYHQGFKYFYQKIILVQKLLGCKFKYIIVV